MDTPATSQKHPGSSPLNAEAYGGREVQRLTSVICHPSSVIRSVICHPSSVICHLTSIIRHLVFSRCSHRCGLFACIRSCICELSNCIK